MSWHHARCPQCPRTFRAYSKARVGRDVQRHVETAHPSVVAACDVPRPATTSLPPEPPVGGQATKPKLSEAAVKCGICGAACLREHATAHIAAHRASGWDGTE